MEIKDIYYDQFREKSDREARLRRVKRIDKVSKARDINDSEKDKEDRKNKGQEVSEPVVIQAKEQNSSTTIELSQKASKIANRYEAQNHMMGQHIGNIDRLRSSLNGVSEKKAIEEVKQTAKTRQAQQAYERSIKAKQKAKEEER